MAAHLRRQNNRKVTVPNSTQAWPSSSRTTVLPATEAWPAAGRSTVQPATEAWPAAGRATVQPATETQPAASPATVLTATEAWPAASPATGQIRSRTNIAPVLSSGSGQGKSATKNGYAASSYSNSAQAEVSVDESLTAAASSSSRKTGSTSRMSHPMSAPNLASSASFDSSTSDFPPVSAQMRKSPTSGQVMLKVEDVHTANKSLVERIRSALEFDEAIYTAFKEISGEYRQGLMDAGTYLAYVDQFGLSHLVIELARLCPDPEKQRELVETYNATMRSNGPQENGWGKGSTPMRDGNNSKKDKGKSSDAKDNYSKDNLANGIINTVRKLQSSCNPSEEEVEVLSKDGYRTGKGKMKVMDDVSQAEMSSPTQLSVKLKGENDYRSAGGNLSLGDAAGGKSKQRKKRSKFHRVRLGDGSVAAILDLKNSESDATPDAMESASDVNTNPVEGLPVRGVWRSGGGQKLLATARGPKK